MIDWRSWTPGLGLLLVAAAAIPFLPGSAQSDDGAGSVIRGKVTLRGAAEAPGRAIFPENLAEKDAVMCGSKRPLITPFYAVGEDGGLGHVVVWIDDAERNLAKNREMGAVVNENCRFLPHVQTLMVGSKVQIENHDPIMHNTHAIYQDRKITAFNVGTPRQGQKVKKKVRRPGVLRVQCDAGHSWMRAWLHVFDHPFHRVTDADGRFELAGLPPGRHTVKAWHELSGTVEQAVEVKPGEAVEIELTFDAEPLPEGHQKGHHH